MSDQQVPDKRPAEPAHISSGPVWDEKCQATRPSAVLVFHGMGQQVKFETISAVAGAILDEAREQGGVTKELAVHVSRVDDQFLARAEVAWRDAGGGSHEVHVYEAYWAPLTEGVVSYWDTITFLLEALWKGLNSSGPFRRKTFDRWMFGGRQELRLASSAFFMLLCAGLLLAYAVSLIAAVSYGYTRVIPVLLDQISAPFSNVSRLPPLWEQLLILAAVSQAFFLHYFLVQYVGDVAAYVSPYKSSKFDEVRKRIQKVGLDVGKVIYGVDPDGSKGYPDYFRILMVGHSLGSVLAYDTLNALINIENIGSAKAVLARTPALITFGSPLDKTAFIFRMQREDWIREQMAAAMQPLIVDYTKYRPPSFTWVNLWSKWDIVSGPLDYYDIQELPDSDPRHVQNQEDPDANVPLKAHIQYWKNPALRKLLYKFASVT